MLRATHISHVEAKFAGEKLGVMVGGKEDLPAMLPLKARSTINVMAKDNPMPKNS